MQKSSETAKRDLPDVKKIVLSAVLGVVLICALCLLMSALVLFRVIPYKFIVFYSALAGFFGGLFASFITGGRGKILVYVAATFALMLGIILVLGLLIFGRPFSFSSNPFIAVAILFGLALGSALSNRR